jgi:DNA-directed RNA polymerase specialized sigma24 family protein
LVQETYLKLCSDNLRLLRTFQPRQLNAIYAFLTVVTNNVVHDHFKAVHAAKRAPELFSTTSELSTAPTSGKPPFVSTQPSLERSILLQQIDHQLMKCAPLQDASRNRLVFWLYYRCGLTASAIASLPNIGLTTKGVESALLRLTRLVKTAMTETSREGDQDQPNSSNPKGFRRPESL